MCQSYKVPCTCQKNTAEIFFGKCILNETAIEEVYCPQCSQNLDTDRDDRVWDNGWVLEMNMDAVRLYAGSMGIAPEEITANRVFDEGSPNAETGNAMRSKSWPKLTCWPITRP